MKHQYEFVTDTTSWCGRCGCLREGADQLDYQFRVPYGDQSEWQREEPACQTTPYEMHYTKDPLVVRRIVQSIMFSELMEGALDDHPVEQRAIGEHVGKLIEILDKLPEKMRLK